MQNTSNLYSNNITLYTVNSYSRQYPDHCLHFFLPNIDDSGTSYHDNDVTFIFIFMLINNEMVYFITFISFILVIDNLINPIFMIVLGIIITHTLFNSIVIIIIILLLVIVLVLVLAVF